jgi:hypothetical protein
MDGIGAVGLMFSNCGTVVFASLTGEYTDRVAGAVVSVGIVAPSGPVSGGSVSAFGSGGTTSVVTV